MYHLSQKPFRKKNNLLPQHASTPSAIQALLQKETFFDLPNIEQLRSAENNPHYWLASDIMPKAVGKILNKSFLI